jgi:hypothetical protein
VNLSYHILGVAIDQLTYATDTGGGIAALHNLLDRVELEGLLVQADALHTNHTFPSTSDSVRLTAFKHSRWMEFQTICDRLTHGRNVPLQ